MPRLVTGRRIAVAIAMIVALPVAIYAVRVVSGISSLTGSSPGVVLGCLTKLHCDSALAKTTNRINIALYGYGGQGHDGAYLTDSIMVVSIQPQSDGGSARIAEISIPRDWYVPIDLGGGQTSHGRINQAYSDGQVQGPDSAPSYKGDPHGGGDLADTTLGELLGIHIDHFVGVDFTAFKEAVDAVGGIDVNVPDSFTDNQYPHGECGQGDCRYMTVHFTAGQQHMNGSQALIFSRSRHAYDNPSEATDFARSRRQQIVLQALRQKVLSAGGIGHLPDLLNALGNHIITDMSFADDLSLYDLVKGTPQASIEHVSIDDQNFLYECGYPSRCPAAYLYARDSTMGSLRHFVASIFPSNDAVAEHAPVTVLDGSGQGAGASGRWTGLLKSIGLNGATDGGAARVSPTTRVIDSSGGRDAKTAQWLASFYGVQVETPPAVTGTDTGASAGGASSGTPAGGVTLILGQDEERAFDNSSAPSSGGTSRYRTATPTRRPTATTAATSTPVSDVVPATAVTATAAATTAPSALPTACIPLGKRCR